MFGIVNATHRGGQIHVDLCFYLNIIIMVPLSERGDFRVASLKLEH